MTTSKDTEELENQIWCEKCQKDFTPEHGGVFDGPIFVEICNMMGISFDRFNLKTNKIEKSNYGEL